MHKQKHAETRCKSKFEAEKAEILTRVKAVYLMRTLICKVFSLQSLSFWDKCCFSLFAPVVKCFHFLDIGLGGDSAEAARQLFPPMCEFGVPSWHGVLCFGLGCLCNSSTYIPLAIVAHDLCRREKYSSSRVAWCAQIVRWCLGGRVC